MSLCGAMSVGLAFLWLVLVQQVCAQSMISSSFDGGPVGSWKVAGDSLSFSQRVSFTDQEPNWYLEIVGNGNGEGTYGILASDDYIGSKQSYYSGFLAFKCLVDGGDESDAAPAPIGIYIIGNNYTLARRAILPNWASYQYDGEWVSVALLLNSSNGEWFVFNNGEAIPPTEDEWLDVLNNIRAITFIADLRAGYLAFGIDDIILTPPSSPLPGGVTTGVVPGQRQSKSSSLGAIIGGTIGGFAVLLLAIFVIGFFVCVVHHGALRGKSSSSKAGSSRRTLTGTSTSSALDETDLEMEVNNSNSPTLANLNVGAISNVKLKQGGLQIEMKDLKVFHPPVGSGAFGVVNKGLYKNVLTVAVKTFTMQEALAEFVTEVQTLSQLHHPNIILFIGAILEPPTIVTEFASRGSVLGIIQKKPEALTLPRIEKIISGVVSGMAFLHSQDPPILHRDLKSSNLLINENWTVKIADFGIARPKADGPMTARAGTTRWMSPEVLDADAGLYGEKADIYSFAIVIWELYAKSLPYPDLTFDYQIIDFVLKGGRPDVSACSDISPDLSSIMQQCWSANADERPTFQRIMNDHFPHIQTQGIDTQRGSPLFQAKKGKAEDLFNTRTISQLNLDKILMPTAGRTAGTRTNKTNRQSMGIARNNTNKGFNGDRIQQSPKDHISISASQSPHLRGDRISGQQHQLPSPQRTPHFDGQDRHDHVMEHSNDRIAEQLQQQQQARQERKEQRKRDKKDQRKSTYN